MKHKILTFFLACLVPWLAGAQQSANSQNNVAEKDYIHHHTFLIRNQNKG